MAPTESAGRLSQPMSAQQECLSWLQAWLLDTSCYLPNANLSACPFTGWGWGAHCVRQEYCLLRMSKAGIPLKCRCAAKQFVCALLQLDSQSVDCIAMFAVLNAWDLLVHCR